MLNRSSQPHPTQIRIPSAMKIAANKNDPQGCVAAIGIAGPSLTRG